MPTEGAEVPVHPPAEAVPSAAVSSPEGRKEVSDRQRAKNAVAEGVGLIKGKYDSGFFGAGDKVGVKKDAEEFLDQAERNNLDSDGLKAFFNSMSAIGGEADGVSKRAAENMRVKAGDRMLTLDQWRAELEAAKKPADGSTSDPERLKELESGVFAYIFPKSTEENPESASVPREESPEDSIITEQLSLLEEKIKKASKKGGETTKEQQQLVSMLRLAKEAKGEAGVLIKVRALTDLERSGVFGLRDTIENLSKEVTIAREKLFGHLKEQNWSEGDIIGFIEAVKAGNVEGMIREGNFPKAEGLDKLFFGRELTDEELQSLLDPEKKGNLLFLLSFIVLGIGPSVVQEATKPRN